jgi:hypothetical protein
MVHGEGSGAIKGSVWIAEAGLCDMKRGSLSERIEDVEKNKRDDWQ